ncbi:MAG TPA: hypothetical protein VGA00_11900 [Acidiferrobacterales bacterium]|jgi:hypothetical protein
MQQPRTQQEYLELADQLIDEMEDLLRCADDEDESENEFSTQIPAYRELLAAIRNHRTAVAAGGHAFADGKDLPFFVEARRRRAFIPFFILIEALNGAHKAGLRP